MIELLKHILTCGTITFVVVYGLRWFRKMSADQLPHFTIGSLVPKQPEAAEPNPIGFSTAPEEKEPSDVEQRNRIMQDAASTVSALLRGELDFDDFRK